LRPIDAPAGAEQEFEQIFHGISVRKCVDEPGVCRDRTAQGSSSEVWKVSVLGVIFVSISSELANEAIAHLMDALESIYYPVLSELV
jgi:hypothetical protein